MKMLIMALLTTISVQALATQKQQLWSVEPNGGASNAVVLESRKDVEPKSSNADPNQLLDSGSKPPSKSKPKPMLNRSKSVAQSKVLGNLPSYFIDRDTSRLQNTSATIIVPSSNLKSELTQVQIGDELRATIEHSIIAFPNESSPVIATIIGGSLNGAKLIGESRLEPNTKRIFISFQVVRFHGRAYAFKASGLTEDKQNGFTGQYHSQEGKLFAGDFISSTVAAYFDGLVPRQANVFGGVTPDNSVDSALKKGASGGAMASADRFKERLKKTPEFSELQGPILTEVLVTGKGIEL